MKELVVISGKGGTGKTSIVGALASLAAEQAVLADCDVDAPDLAIILEPFDLYQESFLAGIKVSIDPDLCEGCGTCCDLCRYDAILVKPPKNRAGLTTFEVDPIACEGCGVCARFCPSAAIRIHRQVKNGEWFCSTTRYGPMIHARLGIAQENSGKLVNLVRKQAKKAALEEGKNLIIIDGPPGIGCPVIASITGSDLALVIAEPTVSALHDLSRVVALTGHFGIETLILINKWDLNKQITSELERFAHEKGLRVAGRISYSSVFTEAQIQKKTVIEYQNNGVVGEIKKAWNRILLEITSKN